MLDGARGARFGFTARPGAVQRRRASRDWPSRTGDGFRLGFADGALGAPQPGAPRRAQPGRTRWPPRCWRCRAGVDARGASRRGLDRFPGLPHRMELVRALDGVEWINDSKATNVDSALVALRRLPPASGCG